MTSCKDCTACSGDIIKDETAKTIHVVFNCLRRPIGLRLVEVIEFKRLSDAFKREDFPQTDCTEHSDTPEQREALAIRNAERAAREAPAADAGMGRLGDIVDEDSSDGAEVSGDLDG